MASSGTPSTERCQTRSWQQLSDAPPDFLRRGALRRWLGASCPGHRRGRHKGGPGDERLCAIAPSSPTSGGSAQQAGAGATVLPRRHGIAPSTRLVQLPTPLRHPHRPPHAQARYHGRPASRGDDGGQTSRPEGRERFTAAGSDTRRVLRVALHGAATTTDRRRDLGDRGCAVVVAAAERACGAPHGGAPLIATAQSMGSPPQHLSELWPTRAGIHSSLTEIST